MSKKHKKHKPGVSKDVYQYVANVNGACASNPGPMGIGGVIVKTPAGKLCTLFPGQWVRAQLNRR